MSDHLLFALPRALLVRKPVQPRHAANITRGLCTRLVGLPTVTNSLAVRAGNHNLHLELATCCLHTLLLRRSPRACSHSNAPTPSCVLASHRHSSDGSSQSPWLTLYFVRANPSPVLLPPPSFLTSCSEAPLPGGDPGPSSLEICFSVGLGQLIFMTD